MSCYKSLLHDNEELKEQLLHAQEDIKLLKEVLSVEVDWVNTQDVINQLSSIDLKPLNH